MIEIFETGERSDRIYLAFDGKKAYIAVYGSESYSRGKIYTDSFLLKGTYRWLEIAPNMSFITSHDGWKNFGTGFFDIRRHKNNSIKEFQRVYGEFMNTAAQEYQSSLVKNARLDRERLGVSKELQQARRLLERLYSCNIIPGTFRYDLYTIWFLYDYISTSNESLSSAFLHFDLNEIKSKLDTVIAQQQDIIINQSLIMSQNEKMIDQNQSYLHKLTNLERTASKIEGNTNCVAYYSEIAASNSEVCKWLSMANYLK